MELDLTLTRTINEKEDTKAYDSHLIINAPPQFKGVLGKNLHNIKEMNSYKCNSSTNDGYLHFCGGEGVPM